MTKQTTQTNQPRSLWLERLERRWMLHAHTEFLSVDQGDYHGDFDRSRLQSAEVDDYLRREADHRLQQHIHSHSGESDYFGDHRVPQSLERFGTASPPPSQAAVPILAPKTSAATITVIVVFDPITIVRPPAINFAPAIAPPVFQNSAPALAEPADVPEVRLAEVDNGLLATLATEAGNQPAESTNVRANLDEGSKQIQLERFVSIQQRETQLVHAEEPVDSINAPVKVRLPLVSPLNLEAETIDNWLSEFSKTKGQLFDLETTLHDLARHQSDRSRDNHDVSSWIQRDRTEASSRANLAPDAVATADEMIWLAPVTDRAESSSMIPGDQWNEAETAQWTIGVGWYQSFEFAEPADMDAVISDSPPIVMAAATTSELVLDGVQQPGQERMQIPIKRSVSYAVVAVSVASWQVLQRRKRPTDERSRDSSQLKQ